MLDDFVAIGVGRRANHLNGAPLERRIGMLSQRHRLHQRQIAALDDALLHSAQQIARAVRALEQNVCRLLVNWRREGRPAIDNRG